MSERPDDLRDDLLVAHLESALGTTPQQLTSRLERLTSVGLHSSRPEKRNAPLWLEVGRQTAGAAVMLVLLGGLIPGLWALVVIPNGQLPAFQLLASPSALTSLMVPIGLLLGVEALRGAPTVMRWLR